MKNREWVSEWIPKPKLWCVYYLIRNIRQIKRKELNFHCSILVSILFTWSPNLCLLIPPSFVVHIPQQAQSVKTESVVALQSKSCMFAYSFLDPARKAKHGPFVSTLIGGWNTLWACPRPTHPNGLSDVLEM